MYVWQQIRESVSVLKAYRNSHNKGCPSESIATKEEAKSEPISSQAALENYLKANKSSGENGFYVVEKYGNVLTCDIMMELK